MGQDSGLLEKIFCRMGRRHIQAYEARFEQQQRRIDELSVYTEKLMKELDEEKEALHGAQIALAEAYAYMQERKELNPHLEENLRNNNSLLGQLSNRIDMHEVKIRGMAAYTKVDIKTENAVSMGAEIDMSAVGNEYDCIDYFDFENHFRGSREAIKNVQRQYIKYFEGRNNILDLGCGRGEFLELLQECQINAIDNFFAIFTPDYLCLYCITNVKLMLLKQILIVVWRLKLWHIRRWNIFVLYYCHYNS